MLSDSQLRLLADILVAVGQVSLASLVIPYFVESVGSEFLTLGILATTGSWIGGLVITREVK